MCHLLFAGIIIPMRRWLKEVASQLFEVPSGLIACFFPMFSGNCPKDLQQFERNDHPDHPAALIRQRRWMPASKSVTGCIWLGNWWRAKCGRCRIYFDSACVSSNAVLWQPNDKLSSIKVVYCILLCLPYPELGWCKMIPKLLVHGMLLLFCSLGFTRFTFRWPIWNTSAGPHADFWNQCFSAGFRNRHITSVDILRYTKDIW